MKNINRIRQTRDQFRQMEGGINERRVALLVDVYEFALDASTDTNLFAALAAEEVFAERRKKLKQEDALRIAMVYALDAEGTSMYDRACSYAKALQPSFDTKVDPDQIENVITQAGGIEALYRASVANEKSLSLGLQLEATLEQLRDALSIEIGETATVEYRRLEDGAREWKRLQIVSVDKS